jgi:diamine N-acetyltransferase
MTTTLLIRTATTEDADRLAQFARTAFRDTYRDIDDADGIERYVAEHFTPEEVAAQIRDPASTVLLAWQGETLIGYAQVLQSEAPPCVTGPAPVELARLYLAQDAIGLGLGARLMLAVQARVRELGGRTVWLGVYDRNQRAIAFYRKFGFVEVGGKEFIFAGQVVIDPVMAAPLPPAGL